MDWQVKAISKECDATGEEFSPGERVLCYINKDGESGELARSDIKKSAISNFKIPKATLGRWTRVIREKSEDLEKEAQEQSLKTAEDLFLSLYEEAETEAVKEQAILKQILALLLERKRILRRLKGQKTENLIFIHVRSKQEFVVGMADFAIPDIEKIQDQLETIVI